MMIAVDYIEFDGEITPQEKGESIELHLDDIEPKKLISVKCGYDKSGHLGSVLILFDGDDD